jgi:type II secretory pathway component GspD/PulD (secretin)
VEGKAYDDEFAPLVDMITATIEPDSWSEAGGPGEIRAVDKWGVLTISQTAEMHEKIEQLIRILRRANAETEAGDGMTPHPPTDIDEKPVSVPVESPAEAAARKQLEAALATVVTIDVNDRPLRQVIDDLAKQARVNFHIDQPALDAIGIGSDTPLSGRFTEITLHSALRLMLREIDLTFVLRDESVLVTSRDEGEILMITRVYKVKDLAVLPTLEKD